MALARWRALPTAGTRITYALQAKSPAAIRETRGDRGLNPSIVISEGRQTCQRHDGAIVLALKGNIEGETAWATG